MLEKIKEWLSNAQKEKLSFKYNKFKIYSLGMLMDMDYKAFMKYRNNLLSKCTKEEYEEVIKWYSSYLEHFVVLNFDDNFESYGAGFEHLKIKPFFIRRYFLNVTDKEYNLIQFFPNRHKDLEIN